MKKLLWLPISFIASTQLVLANGGGYFRGGVERSGDVAGFEPTETEKIRIVDEKLTIALGSHEADVEVRYVMHNETDQKVKVRFGFPVEESLDRDIVSEDSNEPVKELKQLRYCKNYIISVADHPITSEWQTEKKEAADPRFKNIAGWLISEITFAPGEEKQVMIHFKSGYPSENWSVSDNSSESAALFRYRLSTAACWAETIGNGSITLKPYSIDPNELKVLKPVNRFKKEGENWVWNFKNLEPTLADDLEIEASPGTHESGGSDGERYVERGDNWLLVHRNYEVTASSVLSPTETQSYEAANVKDPSSNATWAEGAKGSGKGEWLELKPIVPKPLAAIELTPGYAKSEELFRANARPKKIMVILNDEHRFSFDVPNVKDICRIPVKDYVEPVKKIRLTFEEIWPGQKFEDLCVTAVRLEVKLDKKPEIAPCR